MCFSFFPVYICEREKRGEQDAVFSQEPDAPPKMPDTAKKIPENLTPFQQALLDAARREFAELFDKDPSEIHLSTAESYVWYCRRKRRQKIRKFFRRMFRR